MLLFEFLAVGYCFHNRPVLLGVQRASIYADMESLKVKTVELQYFDGLTNVAVVCWQFFCVWFLSRLIVHNWYLYFRDGHLCHLNF